MRIRQIFLVVSVVTVVCGCSGGNADAQRTYGESRGVSTRENLYKKGPEETPFAFLVERCGKNGEVVRKGEGKWEKSRMKQEIDKKMLSAVLGENKEKKEKPQKNEKN